MRMNATVGLVAIVATAIATQSGAQGTVPATKPVASSAWTQRTPWGIPISRRFGTTRRNPSSTQPEVRLEGKPQRRRGTLRS